MNKNSSLSVHNLSISLGSEFNLNVPKFSINPGEIVAITGKSGSGKSSFIRALIGFSTFNEGVINFQDLQLFPDSKLSHWIENFSYCPQQNIIIDQNVYRNVLLGAEINESSRIQAIEACKCSKLMILSWTCLISMTNYWVKMDLNLAEAKHNE